MPEPRPEPSMCISQPERLLWKNIYHLDPSLRFLDLGKYTLVMHQQWAPYPQLTGSHVAQGTEYRNDVDSGSDEKSYLAPTFRHEPKPTVVSVNHARFIEQLAVINRNDFATARRYASQETTMASPPERRCVRKPSITLLFFFIGSLNHKRAHSSPRLFPLLRSSALGFGVIQCIRAPTCVHF